MKVLQIEFKSFFPLCFMFPFQTRIDIQEFFKIVNLHKQREGETNCSISFINVQLRLFVAFMISFPAGCQIDTTNHELSEEARIAIAITVFQGLLKQFHMA